MTGDVAPSDRFSTDALPAGGRVDFWRELYDGFADVEVEGTSDFSASAQTWRLGPFTVTEATTSGMRFLRRAAHCARSEGDLWVFRLSCGPTWSVARDDRVERIPPGRLWMARTSRPSLTLAPAGRYVLLILPDAAAPELSAGFARLGDGTLSGAGPALLADLLRALPDRLRFTPAAECEAMSEAFRAVVATCLLGDMAPAEVRSLAAGPLARERVMGVIREQIGSARLDVERICRLANVSRSVLYRMFEGEGGVASFVRDMRLRLILEDLRNPALAGMPISEIAERRGLHNAPSFSRAFRRAFGRTPSEIRATAALSLPTWTPPPAAAQADRAGPISDPLGRRSTCRGAASLSAVGGTLAERHGATAPRRPSD